MGKYTCKYNYENKHHKYLGRERLWLDTLANRYAKMMAVKLNSHRYRHVTTRRCYISTGEQVIHVNNNNLRSK